MFRNIPDFKRVFTVERENTVKMFNALTDETLNDELIPGYRSLGRTAWHIVTTIPEMMSQTGLSLSAVDHQAPVPGTVAEIVDAYERACDELLERVADEWDEAELQTEDELYGETWKKGYTLLVLIRHEIHHRGQLTTLMRLAGLSVPGIYGPSKEEWVDYGQPAPAV
ncbi:MAG TPA: DinB family protein [candidate division Zixibacteria bacterium]|nr:DinB family protein [candidate division Zixibacteria bacterium]